MKKAVMILSGGLDSTTLLYELAKDGYEVFCMSFNYGQKHAKELEFAKKTCEKLGVNHKIIDISFMKDLLKSSLTDDNQEIPEGHYEEESMKSTVVPNRNMIFASMAVGYGLSIGARIVATGVHAGDHEVYPDCRVEFWEQLNKVVEMCDRKKISLYAPYLDIDKGDIVKQGIENGTDYGLTRTCYKGLERPCGKCGSCVERAEAFEVNNFLDPLLK